MGRNGESGREPQPQPHPKRGGIVAQGGFLGNYEHTLDARGRLAIPARYRPRFEHGGILVPGPDASLELYPADEFEAVIQQRIPVGQNRAARDVRRALFAQAFDVQLDSQGRIVIPQRMRERHSLEGATVITGMGECLEIWNADNWTSQQEQVESTYDQLLELQPLGQKQAEATYDQLLEQQPLGEAGS